MTTQELFQKECPKCKQKHTWKLGKRIVSNGSTQYPFFCGQCGYITTHYAKKAIAEKMTPPPLELTQAREMPECVVCGKIGAEYHHWAPRYIFGGDCENWPKSYLCVECHLKWHSLVTPDMSISRRKNEN